MKKMKFYFAFMGVFALLFYACSKEENPTTKNEKATLSFGAIVQDMANKTADKQSETGDFPACTDDAAAYVEVVLMQGETEIVGTPEEPFRIDLVDGQVFTEEVPELELDPGTYTLDHFAVYNEAGEVIWLAPKGGLLSDMVDNPLPMNIDLGAGVKKYVDVSVLCYDDRDVNEYGYQFFELDTNRALEFCFFANYCPPEEDGRHFTANYSVSIWKGTDSTGEPLYSGVSPTIGENGAGEFFAEPVCLILPGNDDADQEYLYYEVTLLDWPENYGSVAPNTVLSGVLTAQDIMDNFDGADNVDYEHLRFNCGEIPGGGDCPGGDMDGDGICDEDDNCPNNENPSQIDTDQDGIGNACDETPGGGDPCPSGDMDGDGICDDLDNCPEDANPAQKDTDEDGIGDVCDETPGGGDPCPQGDLDGDGVCDDVDNCPETANPAQENQDGDQWGDACDLCPGTASDENLECPELPGNGQCDTAYMLGDQELDDLNYPQTNWGWGLVFEDPLEEGSFEEAFYNEAEGIWEFPIYGGAGQNDIEKGWLAGVVELDVSGETATVQIILEDGVTINESHIWFSTENWPESRSPGQFNNNFTGEESDDLHTFNTEGEDEPFYLIVHSEVCRE